MKTSRICLALDGMGLHACSRLLSVLTTAIRTVKVHDLVDEFGSLVALRLLRGAGIEYPWVDYKLHDTKDTVALRVKALIRNGARIITVHASGGVEMMQAAVAASLSDSDEPLAEIWAITVLTSLNDDDIKRIYGKDRTREEIVHELALMAKEAGVQTVVCSALEVAMLSRSPNLEGMKFAVPGTRSVGVALGQQKRSGTPGQAVADGATYLVAGTQVTKAENPAEALVAFAREIGEETT